MICRRNLDIIRDRSRSVANLYYTPIDSQGSDLEDDTFEDPNLDDESHLYSEIKDAPWVKKRLMEEMVEIEEFSSRTCLMMHSSSSYSPLAVWFQQHNRSSK